MERINRPGALIGYRKDGRPIFLIAGGAPEDHELVDVPDDLTLIGDTELHELEGKAVAEFKRVAGDGVEVTPESLDYASRLADDIDRIRAEFKAREARQLEAEQREAARRTEQRDGLAARVNGRIETDAAAAAEAAASTVAIEERVTAAAVRGATAAMIAVLGERGGPRDMSTIAKRATTLADVAARAPQPDVPKAKLSVTAGVDIPGLARGSDLADMDALVDAFHRRAKGMPITRGAPREELVATIHNVYEHTVDDRTPIGQVEELLKFLTSPDKADALVAGGGWCAPSEVRYDFFNVACADGQVDLPTIGISRGGIRFPISPSLADAIGGNFAGGFAYTFSNTSIPFLWTETDDVNTVTGNVNKPVVRVPCPTFDEKRLECYGINVTAGNLTDDAYPEATSNFLRLVMAAHEHAMNGRFIASMVTLSSAAVSSGGFGVTGQPVFQQVYNGISLAATDYRARYGMCTDDVLEAVFPYWVRDEIRADLAWRNGVDILSITDAQIQGYFADRNVRVQWVNDWQVRGSGQFGGATAVTNWPTSVTFMLYAAGTFVKGNGLTLDLGVVRDSVLNAENDFTAAWTEECHLVARVGHESRQYTLSLSVNGRTGSANGVGNNL